MNRPATKDMYWFAHGGIETPAEQCHSRLNAAGDVEDDASEHSSLSLKSIGHVKEAAAMQLDTGENLSHTVREREERISTINNQSVGPTRLHATDKRTAVEERKRQLLEAEQERNEAILKKNVERDAALEARRNAHRSNLSFAFGSSIPRNLDLDISSAQQSLETDAQKKRPISTSNLPQRTEENMNFVLQSTDASYPEIKFNSNFFTDGSLGRDCFSPAFYSQSNYQVHEMKPRLPTNCWLMGSGALIADVMSQSMISPMTGTRGRRKNDLTPTIPYDRTAPPRMVSSTSSRKRSVSMSRLDLLAQPRRHYIEAQKASSTISNSSNAGKDSHPSPSRPLSSASEKSGGSTRMSSAAPVTRRPRTAGVKPRPVSIAGTVPDHRPRAETKLSPLGHLPNKKTEVSSNNKRTQALKTSRPKSLSSDRTAQKQTPKQPTIDKQSTLKTPSTTKLSTSKSTTSKPLTAKQPAAPKQSTPKASPSRKLLTNKKQASILVSAPAETLESTTEEPDKLSASPIRSPTPDSESQVAEDKNSGKRIISEEEAKTALAEKRRLAREQAEKEAELEKQRQEEIRLQEEERLRREEEEQKRMEEEQLRLLEEHRRNEEEKLRKAIEERERKEEEEKTKRDEETRLKAEQEKKAKEEAEKQRIELEEKLRKEEEERAERKKRLEKIMSRTRGKTGTSSPSGSLSGSDQPDSIESQPEGIASEPNSLEDSATRELLPEPPSDSHHIMGDQSSLSESLEANPTFTLPCEMESLSSNDLMLPSSENTSLDGSIQAIPSENTSLDSNQMTDPTAEETALENNEINFVLENASLVNNQISGAIVSDDNLVNDQTVISHAYKSPSAESSLASDHTVDQNIEGLAPSSSEMLDPAVESVLSDSAINDLPADSTTLASSQIGDSSESTATLSMVEQVKENAVEVNNQIIDAPAENISLTNEQILNPSVESTHITNNQLEEIDAENLLATNVHLADSTSTKDSLSNAQSVVPSAESTFMGNEKILESVEHAFLVGNQAIDSSEEIVLSENKVIDHTHEEFPFANQISDPAIESSFVPDGHLVENFTDGSFSLTNQIVDPAAESNLQDSIESDDTAEIILPSSNQMVYSSGDALLSSNQVANSDVLEQKQMSDMTTGHDFESNEVPEVDVLISTDINEKIMDSTTEISSFESNQVTNSTVEVASVDDSMKNEFLNRPALIDSQTIDLNIGDSFESKPPQELPVEVSSLENDTIEQDMDITTCDETVPKISSVEYEQLEYVTEIDNLEIVNNGATNPFSDKNSAFDSPQTDLFANNQIGFSDKTTLLHSEIALPKENNLFDDEVIEFGSENLSSQEDFQNPNSFEQSDIKDSSHMFNPFEDSTSVKTEKNSDVGDIFNSNYETFHKVPSILTESNADVSKVIEDVNKNETEAIQVFDTFKTDDVAQECVENSAINVSSDNFSRDYNQNPFGNKDQMPYDSNLGQNISTSNQQTTNLNCESSEPNYEINSEKINLGAVECDNSKEFAVGDFSNISTKPENPFCDNEIKTEGTRYLVSNESVSNQTKISPSDLEETLIGKSHLIAAFENANVADSEDSSLDSNLSQIMNVHNSDDAACEETDNFYPQKETVSNGHTLPTNVLKTGNFEQEGFLFRVTPFYNGDSVPKSNGYTASLNEDVTYGNRFESADIKADQMSTPSSDMRQFSTLADNGVNSNNISTVDNGNILDNVDNVNFNKVSPNPFLDSETLNQMPVNPFLIQEDKTTPTELLS